MPFVTEIAFGYALEGPPMRRIISGVNWSVAIGSTPFRSFGRWAESLDSLLAEQRSGRNEAVIVLIHLACARIEYTDRGKSAVSSRSRSPSRAIGADGQGRWRNTARHPRRSPSCGAVIGSN